MEKEPQPDSLTDVTVKQYAPSEVYSSEPPPAYHRPKSTAVQVARIAAITVVAVAVVLGGFILAAAYVQANASCFQLQQELQLLQEEQRLQSYQPLQPEALVQEEPVDRQNHIDTHAAASHHEQQTTNEKNTDDNNISQDSSESDESSSEDEERTPIHIKLPLQLDFDDLAGALMEKNQRSRMNCIVEKKKAEEVIDHQPKTVRLPFGLNLTTDPRYEHVTGERMAIFCESGDEQRTVPQQQEESMMVQPIIVPLPGPVNLPLQFHGNMQPQQPQMHPQQHMMPHQIEAIRAHTIVMEQLPQRPPVPVQHNVPPHPNQIPQEMQHPNPLVQHIAQQIIAQHEMAAAAAASNNQHHEVPQPHVVQQIPHAKMPMPDARMHMPEALMTHRLPVPEEILTQINRLPNQDVIVSVSEHEAEEIPQEDIRIVQHARENAQEMNGRQGYARGLPVHIPVPMMQQIQQIPQQQEQEARPHYVQPRSVRSVDNALLHREKRVKRCSCDCAC